MARKPQKKLRNYSEKKNNQILIRFFSKTINLTTLWLTNIAVFHFGSKNAQCCDVEWYQSEAKALASTGFFPVGETSWLSVWHNYFYPSLIHFLSVIGINGRSGLTFFQFLLLMLLASIFFSKVIQAQKERKGQLFILLLLCTGFLNYNFTSFGLTEGFSASLLMAFAYAVIHRTFLQVNRCSIFLSNILLSVLASVLWMTRPAFFWLAGITYVLILIHIFFNFRKTSRVLAKSLTLFAVNAIIILPQTIISKNGSLANRLFHFSEYEASKYLETGVFRYTTNLSKCGPTQLIFSPYGQDLSNLNPRYLHNPLSNFAGFVARLVSGWDAFPSSVTYLPSFSFFIPMLVTLLSGFIFISPLVLGLSVVREQSRTTETLLKLTLPFLFLLSQLTVGFTHGEFRYNVAGWILGFMSLMVLILDNRLNRKYSYFFAAGFTFSFFFLVIGQLTLLFSEFWQNCVY
jgi:hypothetical protein